MGRHSATTMPRALRPGIGLRRPHVAELLATRPAVGWLEVHAENYFGGGPAIAELERVRRDYPVSLHGVGLSVGGADALDTQHLARLVNLVKRVEPALEELDAFIDKVLRDGEPFGFVLHGHGTGALKSAVREHLRQHRSISQAQPAERDDGGDALTLFWI